MEVQFLKRGEKISFRLTITGTLKLTHMRHEIKQNFHQQKFAKIPCPVVHIFELLSIVIVFALSAKMPPCPSACSRHLKMQLLVRVTVS